MKKQTNPGRPTVSQTEKLIEDLQIHQIELEAQNKELRSARLETQEALERYTELDDFSPVSMISLNPQGHILECNMATSDLLDHPRSHLINKDICVFIRYEFHALFKEFLKRVMDSTIKHSFEADFRNKKGHIFNCMIYGQSMPDIFNQKQCRMALIDISSQKLKQKEIERLNAELTKTNENLRHEISEHTRVEEMINQLNAELEKRIHEVQTSNEDLKISRLSVLNVMEDAISVQDELRNAKSVLESKVKERTIDLQRMNDQLVKENQERIRTEQSLRLEEARLDALLHLSEVSEKSIDELTNYTLAQAIALTQSEIGFLGFLSEDETIYNLHAVSKDVVKGCNVKGNPIQWKISEAGIWADAVRERRTLVVNDYKKRNPKKKGLPPSHLPLTKFMIVPVFDEGRIVTVAGVANKTSDYDKSDERQMTLLLNGMWTYIQKNRSREELQKAYDELEEKVEQRTVELEKSTAALQELNQNLMHQAHELAAVNKELEAFSYSVSHDLRAPLRSIDGFSQALVEDYASRLDEQGKDYLCRVRNAAQRMGQLIDDMLRLSRLSRSELHVELVDLSQIARQVLEKYGNDEPDRKTKIVVKEDITVNGDRTLLEILMENLLSNSWKFTSHTKRPTIEFGEITKGKERVFFIRDNGAGFNMAYVDKLFLPFQRLHSPDEYIGTGIGLAIVSRIVHRHGGRIWAEGTVGKGACFYFTLEQDGVRKK